jgi:hypothetical protein
MFNALFNFQLHLPIVIDLYKYVVLYYEFVEIFSATGVQHNLAEAKHMKKRLQFVIYEKSNNRPRPVLKESVLNTCAFHCSKRIPNSRIAFKV